MFKNADWINLQKRADLSESAEYGQRREELQQAEVELMRQRERDGQGRLGRNRVTALDGKEFDRRRDAGGQANNSSWFGNHMAYGYEKETR